MVGAGVWRRTAILVAKQKNMNPEIIETELVKANLTDQVISKMRSDYMGLVVKDRSDKPGFEAVSTARKEAKKFRVSVEKFLKALRAPATDFQKAVVAKEKEIVAKIDEIEAYLTSQEEVFNPKEVEEVKELSDPEKIISYMKALLSVRVPEMKTESGKARIEQIVRIITTL